MGININVINWEELIGGLKDKIQVTVNGNINLGTTNNILDKYLSQIIKILEELAAEKLQIGKPKVTGKTMRLTGAGDGTILFTHEDSILLTGISYRQDSFSSMDNFDLNITGGDIGSTSDYSLLDSIYAKDIIIDKRFEPPVLMPAGFSAELVLHHGDNRVVNVYVDFEYLKLEGEDADGTA